jgi:hypothetical protein
MVLSEVVVVALLVDKGGLEPPTVLVPQVRDLRAYCLSTAYFLKFRSVLQRKNGVKPFHNR